MNARPLVLTLLCAATASAAEPPQTLAPPPGAFETLSRLAALLETLQKHYLQPDRITQPAHTTAGLRALVRSLDPEADLLSPDETAPPADETGDIGLTLTLRNGYPTIVAPRDGSPAQLAGLLAGEQILAINGHCTLHARLPEITRQLRGPPGSNVTLQLRAPQRQLTLQRKIPAPLATPRAKFLGAGIAYIRLPEFFLPAVESLHAELQRVEAERARGLILDLRNNPGGAFEAAQIAARLFLPAHTEIVSLEYASPALRTSFISDTGKKFTAPLVLLVNAGTAAEAELFAAALRDNGRARLIGGKTFGRGLFSTEIPLPDGFVLRIPTAYFLPPSKQIFHGTGVVPDIPIELPRDTERRLAAAGFGAFDWVNDRTERLRTDPALAAALELLGKPASIRPHESKPGH